jgi:hypothetical protein
MGWFSSKKEEEELPSVPALQQVNAMGGVQGMQQSSMSHLNNPSEVSQVSQEVGSNGQMNKKDPFFIRMDKFNESKRNLIEIEKKMRDMENVLARLGDAKEREDAEIESWKSDMKEIKGYLEDINESVFSRL